MVCIRAATINDLLAMQACNLLCLPENYQLKVDLGTALQSTIMFGLTQVRCHAVLFLPYPIMASAVARGRGLQWQHCWLCFSQDVSNVLICYCNFLQIWAVRAMDVYMYTPAHTGRKYVCREEDAAEPHGHITSLAVARTHRKLGLASKLMQSARMLAFAHCYCLISQPCAGAAPVAHQCNLCAWLQTKLWQRCLELTMCLCMCG